MPAPVVAPVRALPPDLEPLLEASEVEGLAFLRRLVDDWASGANRFDATGEAFFEARVGPALVGVCGLCRDPYDRDPALGRLRHLYVAPGERRRAVGRSLVEAALRRARGHFRRVRLRTHSEEAKAFYRALGFRPQHGAPDATHALDLPAGPPDD